MIDWEEFYGSFRRPDFIPGYEILNHLGGGAFGEVYKCRKSSIGKSYAVKFLRLDEGSNHPAIERELEQVRHFASIDHPNLVTIEDMGVVLGVPYLIMGYAGEETLARQIKRGTLDRELALRYFAQTCRGVAALHDRRLAHFDLKPGNVFIKGDVARVGDYGLAKLLIEGRQTLSFGRGTPHYMAPEMLKNRADHRADLYSLGVILFESLALRLPYEASGVIRDRDEPPAFPDDFPRALRPVVTRCLRLAPEQRYASVHELAAALAGSVREGADVAAVAPGIAREPVVPSTREDLQRAAAELARGAVGVARGVWSGMLERVAPASEGALAPGAAPASQGLGRDVVTFGTLDDAGEARSADPDDDVAELLRGPFPEPAVATAPPIGTVPVPPRTDGGLFATLGAALVLGAEILGALVTGPVLAAGRWIAATLDRIARSVPGVLGAVLRLAAFLMIAATLGGLVTSVVLVLIWLDA